MNSSFHLERQQKSSLQFWFENQSSVPDLGQSLIEYRYCKRRKKYLCRKWHTQKNEQELKVIEMCLTRNQSNSSDDDCHRKKDRFECDEWSKWKNIDSLMLRKEQMCRLLTINEVVCFGIHSFTLCGRCHLVRHAN